MATEATHPKTTDDVRTTVLQLAQKCLEAFPVVILGSGASAPHGVRGMRELKEHLLTAITPTATTDSSWREFRVALDETNDLEAALQRVRLPDELLAEITHATRASVLADDCEVFRRFVGRELSFPLSRLYSQLLNSTHRTLTVITTNYDRCAEYAAEAARLPWYSGFSRGYRRFFGPPNESRQPTPHETRTVAIWKVHGSVDWFTDTDGVAVALPFRDDVPPKFTPLLVTPGSFKYEATHQEPFRTIIANADAALAAAQSYLCIGYGFNDTHIQPKLIERVRDHATPIVILTKTMRPSAKDFLTKCKTAPFLALEQAGTSTRAYSPESSNGHEVPDSEFWKLDGFIDAVIGAT